MELAGDAGLPVDFGFLTPEQTPEQEEDAAGREGEHAEDGHEHEYPVVALVELLPEHGVLILLLHLHKLGVVAGLQHFVFNPVDVLLMVERRLPVILSESYVSLGRVEKEAVIFVVQRQLDGEDAGRVSLPHGCVTLYAVFYDGCV